MAKSGSQRKAHDLCLCTESNSIVLFGAVSYIIYISAEHEPKYITCCGRKLQSSAINVVLIGRILTSVREAHLQNMDYKYSIIFLNCKILVCSILNLCVV